MDELNINQEWKPKYIDEYHTVAKIRQHTKKENQKYMLCHPEIRAILRVFLHEVINKEPENLNKFAASLFTCTNVPMLISKIDRELKYVNDTLKKGNYCDYDAEDLISPAESTHSLLSRSSVAVHNEALLKYAMIFPNLDED